MHGFGFSFALSESLQFAGGHLLTSLLSFNVGVELGQLFVVALAVPAVELLFRKVVAERMGTILASALLAHTGWHWMTERGSALLAYRFRWPVFDAMLGTQLMRWAALVLIIVGAGWAISGPFGRLAARAKSGGRSTAATGGSPEAKPEAT